VPGDLGTVDPAMLTRPITAAQPTDVIAPNAATMVPRTEGSDDLTERPAVPSGPAWPRGTDAVDCAALQTTAVLATFRFRAGVREASTEDHFFPSRMSRCRADTRVRGRDNCRPSAGNNVAVLPPGDRLPHPC
jgi:hypothetical protein